MTRAPFDALVTRLAASPTTFSERELLGCGDRPGDAVLA